MDTNVTWVLKQSDVLRVGSTFRNTTGILAKGKKPLQKVCIADSTGTVQLLRFRKGKIQVRRFRLSSSPALVRPSRPD